MGGHFWTYQIFNHVLNVRAAVTEWNGLMCLSKTFLQSLILDYFRGDSLNVLYVTNQAINSKAGTRRGKYNSGVQVDLVKPICLFHASIPTSLVLFMSYVGKNS